MVNVCFYFQVHQPQRLRHYPIFDIGHNHSYFDSKKNEEIFRKVTGKCYRPTNNLILELIRKTDGKFKVSYSLTGPFMEQCESYAPELIDSFRELVKTKCVDLLDETYYHSLSFIYSRNEFDKQVRLHTKKVHDLFGISPSVFRNTELIYNNELGNHIESMGYKGILAEGADQILGWRSPNVVYKPQGAKNIRLLLKNYKLSDDIAFRFGQKSWSEFPLTADKFASWINSINGSGSIVNLFMDYETFGEHQWEDKGIFQFLEHLPKYLLQHPDNNFVTTAEACKKHDPIAELDVPHLISWADVERDLSAWLGNRMQQEAINLLYSLETDVVGIKDKKLLSDWRNLQISDHFYYMCTKWFADGDVHKYFNPFDRPHDSFISFMNIVHDLKERIETKKEVKACQVQ